MGGWSCGAEGSEGVGWEVKERDGFRGTSLQRRMKAPSFASGSFLGEEGCGRVEEGRNLLRGSSLQRKGECLPSASGY